MRNSENSINSNNSDLFSDKTLKSARAYLETRKICKSQIRKQLIFI